MARTGKIARLLKKHRDRVCEILRDGGSALAVQQYVKTLVDAGEKDGDGNAIKIPDDQNVTNWRGKPGEPSGYNDWLKEQRRLDDMRFKREFALEVVRQNEGSKLQEASLHMVAAQIYEVVDEFDLEALKELLAEKPDKFTDVVNSLARIARPTLDFQKYRDAVKREADAILKVTKSANERGGLTAADLAEIERAAKMMTSA